MKIEIDDSYIEWVCRKNPEVKNDEDISEYVNEVLSQHRASWEAEDD